MSEQLPLDLDRRLVVRVGPFEFRRLDDGSWWVDEEGHILGNHVRALLDEIVRLRAELEEARSVSRETLDSIPTQVLDSPDDQPVNRTRTVDHGTSAAGARAVSFRAGSQKHRLLSVYAAAGQPGLTDEEAAGDAGLPSSACWWKRCSELRDVGAIEPTGETRDGAAGVPRIVSAISDSGWLLLREFDS